MFQAEYINSFNHNYIKIKNPLQQGTKLRYQYQILITRRLDGFLPVNMQMADGECGLYYEISSKQNLAKWFLKEKIGHCWMEKFVAGLQTALWSMEEYLLDSRNMLLNPQYIFQDMENENIFFLYMPYHIEREKSDMGDFLSFLVEKADEEDIEAVTLLYDMYAKWELLQEQFTVESFLHMWKQGTEKVQEESVVKEEMSEPAEQSDEDEDIYVKKRDFGEFLFGKEKRMKVAEKTTYQEIKPEADERKLYGNGKENRKVISLEQLPIVIGKKGEKADVILTDASISRMHARITEEEGQIYLEDLNATNGTFKNGVRLKPYERVELDKEDEIKLGKLRFTYR